MQFPRFMAATAALAMASAVNPAHAADAGNGYNPKISLILNSSFAHYSSAAPADMPGFLLGDETGLTDSGLSLGETELAAEANIDDQVHGWAALSVAPEGGIKVEEAYVNSLALPDGFALKLGRFFSDIGYQNHQHAHAWDFIDAPLVYRAMLGGQLGDDGLQARWIAPTDLLVEVGAEALRGAAFPGGGEKRNGINNGLTGYLHVGGDAGSGGSWRVGLSHLHSKSDARETGDPVHTQFTGKGELSILDLVYKWAPDGNPSVTNFTSQAEFFYRKENGELVYDPDGADAINTGPIGSSYRGHQQGFYVQAVYQFMPRWRVGTRYDRLSAGNQLALATPGATLENLADRSHDPQRVSLMTDFSNSEFSRVRLQYNRDESRPGGAVDNQVFVQFIFSMGSHPAHQF